MSYDLLMDLSDEQQELVAGGGPTAALDAAFTDYDLYTRDTLNQIKQVEHVSAGPGGAVSQGGQTVTEIDKKSNLDVTAAKFLVGFAGFPAVTLPGVPAIPG